MSKRLEEDNTRERGCEKDTVKYETASMFAPPLNDLTQSQDPSSPFSRVCVYAPPSCVCVCACAYACACVVVCSLLFASVCGWVKSFHLHDNDVENAWVNLPHTTLHSANAVLRLGTSPRRQRLLEVRGLRVTMPRKTWERASTPATQTVPTKKGVLEIGATKQQFPSAKGARECTPTTMSAKARGSPKKPVYKRDLINRRRNHGASEPRFHCFSV